MDGTEILCWVNIKLYYNIIYILYKYKSGLMEQKYCAAGEIDLTQSKQRAVLGA